MSLSVTNRPDAHFYELSDTDLDHVSGGMGVGKVSSDGLFSAGATFVSAGVLLAPESFGFSLLLSGVGGAMMGLAIA